MEHSVDLSNELALIKDEKIRKFTETTVNLLPAYFWTMPASTSKKYHPPKSRLEGGLIHHVKYAVQIAKDLFNISKFTPIQEDIIISALILHDGCKKGIPETKHSKHEHPDLMVEFIIANKELMNICPLEHLGEILGAISTHMGKWTTVSYSKHVLKEPQTNIQKFVHACDYISSRNYSEYF